MKEDIGYCNWEGCPPMLSSLSLFLPLSPPLIPLCPDPFLLVPSGPLGRRKQEGGAEITLSGYADDAQGSVHATVISNHH
eukprot:1657284-Rhodomonas_salina.3